jgi:hypothetical protein
MQAPERISTPTWFCELCSSGARGYLPPPPSDVESGLSSKTSSPNNSLTALPRCERSKTPKQEPAPSMSTSQLVIFISITCASQLLSLSAMNQTVAPVMILARYFRVHNYGELSWFSAAYSMSVGTFILPAGKLSPSCCACINTLDNGRLIIEQDAWVTCTGTSESTSLAGSGSLYGA